jgi:hypothetical protein
MMILVSIVALLSSLVIFNLGLTMTIIWHARKAGQVRGHSTPDQVIPVAVGRQVLDADLPSPTRPSLPEGWLARNNLVAIISTSCGACKTVAERLARGQLTLPAESLVVVVSEESGSERSREMARGASDYHVAEVSPDDRFLHALGLIRVFPAFLRLEGGTTGFSSPQVEALLDSRIEI